MEDNKLAKGLYAFMPHEKAPDWVKLDLSVNVKDFVDWLQSQPQDDRGSVRITIAEGKSGKLYGKFNDFKPKEETVSEDSNDLPF